ncbi:MAG: triose-phosphate isomerase [Bacteroidetes bacterium]|nr:triose-phosphate isomerase [Bacteroidota bacterium]
MRKKIVAGNWKMNKSLSEAIALLEALDDSYETYATEAVEVVVAPPFPYLFSIKESVRNKNIAIKVAAQNCHHEEKGAYTGEVSASMLSSIGIDYIIIGHSERRQYFNENSAQLKNKIQQAFSNNLTPIYCVGESLAEREANRHFEIVEQQLTEVLAGISPQAKFVVAYEPVWAIGTGKTASVNQAQEMHAFIRAVLQTILSPDTAAATSVLYGGSCNAQNAKDLFACTDIDGGLIGGASLDATQFITIIKSF